MKKSKFQLEIDRFFANFKKKNSWFFIFTAIILLFFFGTSSSTFKFCKNISYFYVKIALFRGKIT